MNVTACSPHMTQRNFVCNAVFAAYIYQSQRNVLMFASKQQHMPSHLLNLPFYDAVNLLYLYGS